MTAAPAEILGWATMPAGEVVNPKWQPFVSLAPARLPGVRTLLDVEQWVNRNIRYVRDTKDRWQHPIETLQSQSGDCEDFALLKMALLKGLGHTPFFVICKDTVAREQHAVAVAAGMLFDNHQTEPRSIERPLSAEVLQPMLMYCGGERYIFGRRRAGL